MSENETDFARIGEAIVGRRGKDQMAIAIVGTEWLGMMLRKNHDYGSAVWQSPRLRKNLSPGDAILVRISDKIDRLESLQNRDPEVGSESFDDTIRDLGAYCLLYLARPRMKKPTKK